MVSDMSEDKVLVPMRGQLYRDIVRFSDGRIDPAEMAEQLLENWIGRDLEIGDGRFWGDRFEEVAQMYAPHLLEVIAKQRQSAPDKRGNDRKPLVWKEVTISAGSEVRMAYGDTHHYAKVARGSIIDDGKEYSPSEWASKVAGNKSRNAWRDLWFREPFSKAWVPAQLLRDQARQDAGMKPSDRDGGHDE